MEWRRRGRQKLGIFRAVNAAETTSTRSWDGGVCCSCLVVVFLFSLLVVVVVVLDVNLEQTLMSCYIQPAKEK